MAARLGRIAVSISLLTFSGSGCQGTPEGLALASGDGPLIRFDLDQRPLPEIPFPNDLATRPDPSSPTGRRFNASLVAPTSLEVRTRQMLDRLDGFGLLQPISVSFDAPLDLEELLRRHRDNLDFADDAVYLLAVDRAAPDFGQPVMLDIGRGNYPLTLADTNVYFANDGRAGASNAVFDTYEEDNNGNAIFDDGEDSDDDGVFDHPNVWPPGARPEDGLLTFYESETNTLVLRPLVPLREGTTYAVVLTDRLVGRDGRPVRSPFSWNHHLSQREALQTLPAILAAHPEWNLLPRQVAFAWTFTTQAASAELLAIREGLHGIGPFAWLAERFPDRSLPDQMINPEHPDSRPPSTVLPAQRLLGVVQLLGPRLLGEMFELAEPILSTFAHIDYFVSGSFESPDFLRTSRDGLDQENPHREVFSLDLFGGRAEVDTARLRFIAAVPKTTEHHRPPFPVVIYCHSYSSMRAEALGFAGYMARHGLATVGIDAWGHGLPLDDALTDIIMTAARDWGFEPFAETLLLGRARDLTGDGVPDSGGDYWTAYGFHVRDAVRQTIVDHLQLVRVLRAFDGLRTWANDADGDGKDDLAGDFNGDGTVDFGGPNIRFFAWGQSGGAIHSSILGPLEPAVLATAPAAGGGGLADVGVRTMLGNVRRASMLRTMGPLVVGLPAGPQAVSVWLIVPLATEERRLPVDTVAGVLAGDRVRVENLGSGETVEVRVREDLRFRASIAADREHPLRISLFHKGERSPYAVLERFREDVYYLDNQERGGAPTYRAGERLRSPTEGFGLARCTPGFRRMLGLFQMILEPADPATYAVHYFRQPLEVRPQGLSITNVLQVACAGDQDVPISTAVTFGRAAGVIPWSPEDTEERLDGLTPNDWLVAHWVPEGLARLNRFPQAGAVFDPDDLDEGTDGFGAPEPAPTQRLRLVVETATGSSGIRFAYLKPSGQHGVFPTGEESGFDMFSFIVNQVAEFFASGGRRISDQRCLEDASCPLPPYEPLAP